MIHKTKLLIIVAQNQRLPRDDKKSIQGKYSITILI